MNKMNVCALCKSGEKDDVKYGEFLELKKEKLSAHHYCLYLTSNLCQNGDVDSPECLFGFMPKDIRQEERRISKLYCCYCLKNYANIGCCERKCRRTFHLICGIKNGAENQFISTFNSYCNLHVRKEVKRPKKDEQCCICYDNLVTSKQRFSHVNMLLAPCCKNGWFHKFCLQNFAKSAGYFFKCPLCNDTEIVRKKLPYKGIFIPNRDAEWELEPEAFAELLARPNECVATICKSSGNRTDFSPQNPLLRCNTCGSSVVHKYCLSENKRNGTYVCTDCDVGNENNYKSDTDEEVDVCNDCDEIACANSIDSEDELLINLCKNRQRSTQILDTDESSSEDELLKVKSRVKSRKLSNDECDSDINENINSKGQAQNDAVSDLNEVLFKQTNENIEDLKQTVNVNDITIHDSSVDELETFFERMSEKDKNVQKLEKRNDDSRQAPENQDLISQINSDEILKFQYSNDEESEDELEKFKNIPIAAYIDDQKQASYPNTNTNCEIKTRTGTAIESKNEKQTATLNVFASIDEELKSCSSAIQESSNGKPKHSERSTTSTNFKLRTDITAEQNAIEKPAFLNVSCIANRTRRKSVYYSADEIERIIKPVEADAEHISNDKSKCLKMREKSASLNMASIVNLPRRNSIGYCAEGVNVYKDLPLPTAAKTKTNDEQYFPGTSSTTFVDDVTNITRGAKRMHRRKSMNPNLLYSSEKSSTENNNSMDISCVARRTRKRKSMHDSLIHSKSYTLDTISSGQPSTSCSSSQPNVISSSETIFGSSLSLDVKDDSTPSTSGANSYSGSRRKVFVKRKHCSTITKPNGRLSSTDDENYVINHRMNVLQRNFCNENAKSPMRAVDTYAYITPAFKCAGGKFKRDKTKCIINEQHNFKSSYNLLTGIEKENNKTK